MRSQAALLCIAFMVFSTVVNAQDWKSQYDQAVRLYQQENYTASLEAAQQAYSYVQKSELKNLAYTLQLITANYSQLPASQEAISYSDEEAITFLKAEGDKSKNYAEALKKQLSFYYDAERIKEAYEKSNHALQVTKEVYSETSYQYAALLSFVGQVSVANNQFQKAEGELEAALLLLEKMPEAGEDYLNTLSLSADLKRRNKAIPEAEKKYRKVLSILEQNGMQGEPIYVETKKNLDRLIFSTGDPNAISTIIAGGTEDAGLLAQSYLKLAIDFQQQGNVLKAAENYELGKKIVVDGNLLDKTAFSIFLNATRFALDKRKMDQAQKDLLQTKRIGQQLFDASQVELRIVELTEADLLIETGETEKALLVYSSVSAFASQNPSAIPVSFLVSSAKRLLQVHRATEAFHLLKPVVESRQTQDASQLNLDILFSEILLRLGRADEASSYLQRALERAQQNSLKAAYQMQLAEVQKSKGSWNEALNTLLKIQAANLPANLLAEIDYQKARLHQVVGQYREAEQLYRSAIAVCKNIGDEKLLQQVNNSMATYYTTIGNYEAAEDVYEKILADKTLDENFRITVFQNLATVYQQTLRYKEAQSLLEQVVREDALRLGENDPDYALSLQNLASVYQRNGDPKRAVQLYSKALAIDASTSGESSLAYATKAANLGVVQMELGELKASEENLMKALRTRERILGKEHPDYVFNEYNLAVLYQRQQRVNEVLPLYKHVSSFYINQIAELFPSLSEKEKTTYYNKIGEVIQAYMDFAIDQAPTTPTLLEDLFNFRLMTKALLLNSSTKIRNRILSGNDMVLKQQFTEWLQVKEELGKLYTQNQESRNQNRPLIESLQQRSNEIEKQLAAKSELFAKSSDREVTTWQQVRATLKPSEAAVEMIRLRLNYKNDSVIYAALVIRSDWTQPKMVVFSNGRSMEDKEFKYYRNATRFNVVNERSYTTYWAPLESLLKDAATIYFSSDGVYNKINLTSLFNKEKQQYLIDQHSFLLLSNLKELKDRSESVPAVKMASLFGSPDFGISASANGSTPSTLRAIVGSDFKELPGTKIEVERIGALLQENQWKVSQFISKEASEEKLKAIVPAGILHIATHGFFVADNESNAPVVHTNSLDQMANNPLLRSGLILSGAGREVKNRGVGEEDGVLTAYEAVGLPLENTNLVILSACETGQGEVRNGEGVYGLQRAILLAGAQHLLMSLWKVDDEATQELMAEFYKQWLATNNLTIAYRNAQMSMKGKYGMPQYWAGFVLLGI